MSLNIDIERRVGAFHLRVPLSSPGGSLAILGPSGCGKSMTLRCVAGIDRPDRGWIEPLITHTYPLSRIEEAYELFENRRDNVIKVAVECS